MLAQIQEFVNKNLTSSYKARTETLETVGIVNIL